MSKVLIIGGGAAGMFASAVAAENGHEVHVYEKNEKLGRKLFITGKGRCNLTNACKEEEIAAAVTRNSKFLYGALNRYTNQDVIRYFERLGVKTKVERAERVFPVSDHSSDVIRALEREMERLSVTVHLKTEVCRVLAKDKGFAAIVLKDGQTVYGDACIVASGGLSYPSTGSTGDGLTFAEELGHQIAKCMPSLVPMETLEPWAGRLQGLSLKNVSVSVYDGKKSLYHDFGEMLFTHYGVSGPLILSASSFVAERLIKGEAPFSISLVIDLKPALAEEQLDQRVVREFAKNPNRQFKNVAGVLFPAKLTPVMVDLSGIDPEKRVNVVSRGERRAFVHLIKHLKLTFKQLRGYDEAIITKGGVCTKEINPKTMESKLVKGLYFAGEVLDVDALTGGFNLQIAWSTAFAAANGLSETRG